MQTSIIKHSETISVARLDAEFFHPESIKLDKNLLSKPHIKLSELVHVDASAFYPSLEPYYNQGNIPFIRVKDVNDGISTNSMVTVPYNIISQAEFNTLKTVYPNDIVITKGGSIARSGLVEVESLACRDLIFLNSHILKGYQIHFLYIYLITDSIKKWMIRTASQIAQPHLTLPLIRQLPVITVSEKFQKNIEDMVLKAHAERENANTLTKEAQTLLEKELGIYEWTPTKQKLNTSIKKHSDTTQANRIDAEYYQPKYDAILEKITSYKGGYKALGECFEILSGKNLKYSTKGNIPVVKTKQLTNQGIKLEVEDFTEQATVFLKDKDVVFASMGVGSLGKSSVFYNPDNKLVTIDSTLKIFRGQTSINAEVLGVYLQLPSVYEYIYKFIVGSSGIINIYGEYISAIPIPILDKKIQDEIAIKITNAHQSRQESKRLLELAKSTVEHAIEHGETKK